MVKEKSVMESKYIDEFKREAENIRDMGFNPYADALHLRVSNAKERMIGGLHYYLGERAVWLPEYDAIADWLTDNKGRGLLCVGPCGLGKTLICQNILPMIIHSTTRIIPRAATAPEMNRDIDRLLGLRCVIVDDLGTEPADTNTYGNRRYPFTELVDDVERRRSLLIVTTNLRTTHGTDPKTGAAIPSIEDRYGQRTLDRLRATTRVVVLSGKSLRQ